MRPHELLMQVTAPADENSPMPATMLVFAHPDDETIALGGRLSRFAHAWMVQVTDGAPRDGKDSKSHGFAHLDDYRSARRAEFSRVLGLAGLTQARCEFLEIPDQEAALSLVELTLRIAKSIEQVRPECIVTHPWEGGHPDHDACAFVVHYAVNLLQEERRRPAILEAAFYHEAPGGMVTGRFPAEPPSAAEVARHLAPREQSRKRALLACYSTQQQVLSCFGLEYERFRVAPLYDFLRRPPGPVLYDKNAWGMNSQRFCQLANEAAEKLPERIAA